MPTVTDATVVASAYNTSSNSGRKLVRLDTGNLYSAMKTSTAYYIYKSIDNGNSWTNFKTINSSSVQDIALETNGKFIFVINSIGNNTIVVKSFNEDSSENTGQNVDTSQNVLGNVSLAINEAKTELHAAWASKNATYPNSFNIRYAKGTINADGTVTWGAVEQWTKINITSQYYQNPAIVVINNYPYVFVESYDTSVGTSAFKMSLLTNKPGFPNEYPNSLKGSISVSMSGYAQSSPSAIFVPQSINGLANGRIWVVWHGMDAIDTGVNHILVSYSDDGGVTWSATDKLTSGATSRYYPTITVNKNNKIFILFSNYAQNNVQQISYDGTWSSVIDVTTIKSNNYAYPSVLFDLSVDFTSPLFIYKDTAKVGFYGTWTVTTISVTPGDIGQKTDRNELLAYSITTDGEMSDVVEKINGQTIATKALANGEETTVSLTQEQWDSIRFGKYTDNNPKNLITSQGLTWENGTYTNILVGQTLTKLDNANSLRTNFHLSVEPSKEYILKVSDAYRIATFETDENGVVTKAQSSLNTQLSITTLSNTKRLYLLIFNSSISTPIQPSAVDIARPTVFNNLYSRNSIEISMDTDKWTYTFDKRLATDADIVSAVKATKDANEVYLPSTKKILSDAINLKGGNTSPSDSIESMASAVASSSVIAKSKNGTITSSSSTMSFTSASGGAVSLAYISLDLTVLGFSPQDVEVVRASRVLTEKFSYGKTPYYQSGNYYADVLGYDSANIRTVQAKIQGNMLYIPVGSQNQSYDWIAYG